MTDSTLQKDNLTDILDRVSNSVSSSETRSLWEKIREEIRSGGPDAAVRYIAAELDRCEQDFARALDFLRQGRARRQ